MTDLTKLMREADCPNCWMTAQERAAAALDEFFTDNRKAALLFDGSLNAKLLKAWAEKCGCELKCYSSGDLAEICNRAKEDGFLPVLGLCDAESENMSEEIRLGVKSPLFLCRVYKAEIFVLSKKLGII